MRVAVKICRSVAHEEIEDDTYIRMLNERIIGHPGEKSIIKLFGAYKEFIDSIPTHVFVFEECGISLYDLMIINEGRGLYIEDIRIIASELISAISFCLLVLE